MDETFLPAQQKAPGRRWRVLLWLLPLLALALLGVTLWQFHQTGQEARQALALNHEESDRIASLQDALGSLQQEREGLSQRLDDAAAVNRALREELLGLRDRTRTLEDALAALSESRNDGTEALRLDEAEFLLRIAEERYSLFHDARGALDAAQLANQTLANVDAPAYAPLRSDVSAAIDALTRMNPDAWSTQLATLTGLRAQVWQLHLASALAPQPKHAGLLARIGHALAGLVRIRRTHEAPLAGVGAELLHEMLALDLAQAQAALLAWNETGYQTALGNARALLEARFDSEAESTRRFRAQLDSLQAVKATPVPQLGTALDDLRRIRAVEALQHAAKAKPVQAEARR